MLLLAGVVFVKRAWTERQAADAQRAIVLSLAQDLEAKTNSTYLASMPGLLRQALVEFLTSPGAYLQTARPGDEPPPVGDGQATYRLYLRNSANQCLAMRLRYDRGLQKFDVIGVWHPTVWPE